MVTLLCRHDEVHVEAMGRQDLAAATPMRRDTVFHTSCYVDPQEDMIAILLAQRLMTSPRPSDFYTDFWTLVYQAIDD